MPDTTGQQKSTSVEVTANGVNGSTGDFLVPPVKLTDLSKYIDDAENLPSKQPVDALVYRKQRAGSTFAVEDDIQDPNDVAHAGWGVIFPANLAANELAGLRAALKPLCD